MTAAPSSSLDPRADDDTRDERDDQQADDGPAQDARAADQILQVGQDQDQSDRQPDQSERGRDAHPPLRVAAPVAGEVHQHGHAVAISRTTKPTVVAPANQV